MFSICWYDRQWSVAAINRVHGLSTEDRVLITFFIQQAIIVPTPRT